MPWKECSVMNERMKFILRLQNGERMSDLCHEFGISRPTGYKFLKRFEREGVAGLNDQSREARINGRGTNPTVQKLILDLKKEYPTWGAPKIKEILNRRYPGFKLPAISTVHAILDRNDLVRKRRSKRYRAEGTNLKPAKNPNDLWCTDFKGQFRLLNNHYCFPLTISDQATRNILGCDALESINEEECFSMFTRTFQEFGLPHAIRSDNGAPFSTRSLFGLSRLSVWWLRLGIKLERIEPGHPEQNGRHERMHRTLKQDIKIKPAKNILQQQEYFDDFVRTFNTQRPHEALSMKTPCEIYKKSNKEFPKFLSEPTYADCDKTIILSKCGCIYLNRQTRVFISMPLGGQPLGLSLVEEGIWSVRFMDYDLGFFDEESKKFTPGENPFKLGGFTPIKKV